MKMNMEHWWDDTDSGKPKYWEKNVFKCRFIRHRSPMDWSRIERVSLF